MNNVKWQAREPCVYSQSQLGMINLYIISVEYGERDREGESLSVFEFQLWPERV